MAVIELRTLAFRISVLDDGRLWATVNGDGGQEDDAIVLPDDEQFRALQHKLAILRIEPADTQALGGKPVVVLSDDFWARRFARDSAVIGKTVTMNRVPVTVVGVAARGFSGLTIGTRLDCWLPVTMQQELGYYTNAYMEDADARKPWLTQDGIEFLNIVARLPDGIAHSAVPARSRS